MSLRDELIRRLEIRKGQLLGEIDLGYKVHQGHHLRDVFTVIQYLKGNESSEALIKNLPNIIVRRKR